MYPLSFSRLKYINQSDAAFIAACTQPKKPTTADQMLGRVIERALLYGDYKTACKTELDKSKYPSTIEEMAEALGEKIKGGKKADYEALCAQSGIVTYSSALADYEQDLRDIYYQENVEMIDGLVFVAGHRFKYGVKQHHFQSEQYHGFIDWHDDETITDIKTYRSTGREFYDVCAREMYLEQLAFYHEYGVKTRFLSVYAIEKGDGFTNSQEFIFQADCDAVSEAKRRVERWIKRAEKLEPLVNEAKQSGGMINLKHSAVLVEDNAMPIWYYKEAA